MRILIGGLALISIIGCAKAPEAPSTLPNASEHLVIGRVSDVSNATHYLLKRPFLDSRGELFFTTQVSVPGDTKRWLGWVNLGKALEKKADGLIQPIERRAATSHLSDRTLLVATYAAEWVANQGIKVAVKRSEVVLPSPGILLSRTEFAEQSFIYNGPLDTSRGLQPLSTIAEDMGQGLSASLVGGPVTAQNNEEFFLFSVQRLTGLFNIKSTEVIPLSPNLNDPVSVAECLDGDRRLGRVVASGTFAELKPLLELNSKDAVPFVGRQLVAGRKHESLSFTANIPQELDSVLLCRSAGRTETVVAPIKTLVDGRFRKGWIGRLDPMFNVVRQAEFLMPKNEFSANDMLTDPSSGHVYVGGSFQNGTEPGTGFVIHFDENFKEVERHYFSDRRRSNQVNELIKLPAAYGKRLLISGWSDIEYEGYIQVAKKSFLELLP